MIRNLLFIALFFSIASKSNATIYFVNASASPSGNGLVWSTAFSDLQSALSIVISGDEIWVATGQYKPTSTTDRTASFILKDGVNIYGNFTGNETSISQRNMNSLQSILSGDIGGIGVDTDNSHNVVKANNISTTITLDGFRIMNGYSNIGNNGGGLKVTNTLTGNVIVKHCLFYGNYADVYGGAVYLAGAKLTIENCELTNNTTSNSGNGGAICNGNNNGGYSILTIRDTKFKSNVSRQGACFYNTVRLQKLLIDRCVFTNNSGPISVIDINDCVDGKIINSSIIGNSVSGFSSNVLYVNSPTGSSQTFELVNCTVSNNYNTYANTISDEIIRLDDSFHKVYNCIIYGNTKYAGRQINVLPTISNSLIEGGFANGTNIINQNPLFVNQNIIDSTNFDVTSFDYSLTSTSPGINAGANSFLGSNDTLDLILNQRIQFSTVDLGCYESTYNVTTSVSNLNSYILNFSCYYSTTYHQLYFNNSTEFIGQMFSICDVHGRLIGNSKLISNTLNVDLPAGIYFIIIEKSKVNKFLVY